MHSIKAEFSVINLTGREDDTHEISGLVESGTFMYSLPRSISQSGWLDALNTIFTSLTDEERTKLECPGVMTVWQKTTTAILERFPQLDFRIALFVSRMLSPLPKPEDEGGAPRVGIQSHDKWLNHFIEKKNMLETVVLPQSSHNEKEEGETDVKHTDGDSIINVRGKRNESVRKQRHKRENDITQKVNSKSQKSSTLGSGDTFEKLSKCFEGGCLLKGVSTEIEWTVKVMHVETFRYIDVRFKPRREPGLDDLLQVISTVCQNLMDDNGELEELWGTDWSGLVYFLLIGQGIPVGPLLFFVENRNKFHSSLFRKYLKNTIELVSRISLNFGVIVRISPKMGFWDTTSHKQLAMHELKRKKSVVRARNNDGLGLARAIAAGMLPPPPLLPSKRKVNFGQYINSLPISKVAEQLQKKAGVAATRFATTADFDAFQNILPDHRLVIFGDMFDPVVLYRVPFDGPSDTVYLYIHESTVCLIRTSPKGFFRWKKGFCDKCLRKRSHSKAHLCWFMSLTCQGNALPISPTL